MRGEKRKQEGHERLLSFQFDLGSWWLFFKMVLDKFYRPAFPTAFSTKYLTCSFKKNSVVTKRGTYYILLLEDSHCTLVNYGLRTFTVNNTNVFNPVFSNCLNHLESLLMCLYQYLSEHTGRLLRSDRNAFEQRKKHYKSTVSVKAS